MESGREAMVERAVLIDKRQDDDVPDDSVTSSMTPGLNRHAFSSFFTPVTVHKVV